MRTFIILWLGQIASSIGSSMTYFALTLWIWQETQSATAIALILFFYQLPQIAIALFSGILVDRVSRKRLLILSDTGAGCCTLAVGILSATQLLQPWHLYLIAGIIGCFGNLQALTYSTTIALIVPKNHHTRAISMGAMVGYGAEIFAPALSGLLYDRIGLLGITLIDLVTFAIAVLTLLIVSIPRTQAIGDLEKKQNFWQETTFGFRYIAAQPNLLMMVIAFSAFAFFNQMNETLYQPMILTRTGGDAQVLGAVVAAAGIGGMVGAIGLSIWSGFRKRIFGMLFGFIVTGLSGIVLSVSQFSIVWAIAQFTASLHSPLIHSSYMAVWYAKIAPEIQGRVFAADYLIGLLIGSSSSLVAGVLADRVFEPAMQSGDRGFLIHAIVGRGTGSGIAVLLMINALCIVLVGMIGFMVRQLREAESYLPDHES